MVLEGVWLMQVLECRESVMVRDAALEIRVRGTSRTQDDSADAPRTASLMIGTRGAATLSRPTPA